MSKVISRLRWFCITTLCDWLTKLAPLSQPMGIQTKTNPVLAAPFSCAWRQLHVFASNSDWLVKLLFTPVSFGQSNYFGFGFMTLNWKPLYGLIANKVEHRKPQFLLSKVFSFGIWDYSETGIHSIDGIHVLFGLK